MTGNLLIPKLPLHHSVADWDFLNSNDWAVWGNWGLTSDHFVSPPTSLFINPWPQSYDVYALSKHPYAQDLKKGQIITWHRRHLGGTPRVALYIGVSAADKAGIHITPACYSMAWAKTIFQWWQDFDEQCNAATHIYYRTWVNGALAQTVHLYEKALTNPINRVGVAATFLTSQSHVYYDDTEIYISS